MTSENLTKAIFYKDKAKVKIAKECYRIPSKIKELYSEELQRYIIPLYRHSTYRLKGRSSLNEKYVDYINAIKQNLAFINKKKLML